MPKSKQLLISSFFSSQSRKDQTTTEPPSSHKKQKAAAPQEPSAKRQKTSLHTSGDTQNLSSRQPLSKHLSKPPVESASQTSPDFLPCDSSPEDKSLSQKENQIQGTPVNNFTLNKYSRSLYQISSPSSAYDFSEQVSQDSFRPAMQCRNNTSPTLLAVEALQSSAHDSLLNDMTTKDNSQIPMQIPSSSIINFQDKISHASQPPTLLALSRFSQGNTVQTRDYEKHIKFHDRLVQIPSKKLPESDKSGPEASMNLDKLCMAKLTPLEKQFVEIKRKNMDVTILVECGYKYRFFGEDAHIASAVCRIISYVDHNFITASIPTFRLGFYVAKLVNAGYKVGIVRQTETAALKKVGDNSSSLFTRSLTNIYTRGTFICDGVLGDSTPQNLQNSSRSNAFTMCIYEIASQTAVIAIDVSTGNVIYDSFEHNDLRLDLETRLFALQPVEIIAMKQHLSPATEKMLRGYCDVERRTNFAPRFELLVSSIYSDATFLNQSFQNFLDSNNVHKSLRHFFSHLPGVLLSCVLIVWKYLDGFGLSKSMILSVDPLSELGWRPFVKSTRMRLDANSLRAFEIFSNSNDGSVNGSVFSVINQTQTGMGARKLKDWLLNPLIDPSDIEERLCAVDELRSVVSRDNTVHPAARILTSEVLSPHVDMERGFSRIYHRKCDPKEFMTIIDSFLKTSIAFDDGKKNRDKILSSILLQLFKRVPNLHTFIQSMFKILNAEHANLNNYSDLFCLSWVDNYKSQEQNIDSQFSEELAELKTLHNDMEELESKFDKERILVQKQLKVKSLTWKKVAQDEYLIEVPLEKVATIPNSWLRVNQTKAVARFRTPKASELVDQLNQLREMHIITSKKAWNSYLNEFSKRTLEFKQLLEVLATLDALGSLAKVSCIGGYCRPKILKHNDESCFIVRGGRHPVYGDTQRGVAYVPNDVIINIQKSEDVTMNGDLDIENLIGGERAKIITGPNMGGKSMFIRMSAVLAIMAQIGSFIPAEAAWISPFDGIFGRLGASDYLSRGLSTFMTELSETSEILKRITKRSLVILDELGRGTSTHDGTAIAYATLKNLAIRVKCSTLFVTHYPCIGQLAVEYPHEIGTYHMSYEEHSDKETITFLYKLVQGLADRSYGLNVARMAGLSDTILKRAQEKAKSLEEATNKKITRQSNSLDPYDIHTLKKLLT